MQRLIIVLMLLLPMLTAAQSEQEQKQQKKVENSRPNGIEVQPSFGYPRPVYPIYPTYPYFSDYSRRYKSYQSTPISVSVGASIAVSTRITEPTSFGFYMTLGKNNGLYLHARQSKSNPSKYYDNINRLEAEQWGDQYQGEFIQRQDIGIGYLLNKDQVNHIIGINIQTTKSDLNYIDLTGILPYRGDNLYSIEREVRTKINPMYGILHPIPNTNGQIGAQITIQRNPLIQASIGLSF
jgi:hypothetical protein